MADPDDEARLRQAAAGKRPAADFADTDLAGVRLPSARLAGASFRSANLPKIDLSGAYLAAADFSESNLKQARLVGADLRGAKFCIAFVRGADLSSAVLTDADLSAADLAGCKLTKALLTAANLKDANLARADLRGIRGATPEQIRAAENWRKAIFDPEMARALEIDQDLDTSRHGARPARKKASTKAKAITVDVLAAKEKRPTFGDLFVICGSPHPRFPPSGNCDLSALASLGFEQTDDYFAIPNKDGDPVVWLYPVLRDKPAHHDKGPFDGVRLELPRLTKALARRFLGIVSGFVANLEGTLRAVEDERPGEALSFEELHERIDSVVGA
jgi:hypothetical protein